MNAGARITFWNKSSLFALPTKTLSHLWHESFCEHSAVAIVVLFELVVDSRFFRRWFCGVWYSAFWQQVFYSVGFDCLLVFTPTNPELKILSVGYWYNWGSNLVRRSRIQRFSYSVALSSVWRAWLKNESDRSIYSVRFIKTSTNFSYFCPLTLLQTAVQCDKPLKQNVLLVFYPWCLHSRHFLHFASLQGRIDLKRQLSSSSPHITNRPW